MSQRTSREIDALQRLDEYISCYDAILDFLTKENLLERQEALTIRSSSNIPKSIHTLLNTLQKTRKLQLLEYEWVVLPLERVKLSVITDRDSREFSYGY